MNKEEMSTLDLRIPMTQEMLARWERKSPEEQQAILQLVLKQVISDSKQV